MKADLKQKIYKNKVTLTAILFIAVGVFVRIIDFGKTPNGFNQDEAFAAYEAFSLLNFGVDSAGNVNPTYFVSWGSGMNVLESYLAIPFMWLFGYSETVFRLPQLLCAIITLPVFFFLLKRLFNNAVALIGLGLLAISPWHIMLSRWGLESNLSPAFLLFGLFFLIKGIENNRYFLFSALFYGLSLYTYSITWLTVPIMLIVFSIYIVKNGRGIKIGYIIGACLILALFAIPHILFLLINNGVIGEIKTPFFTIPKLVEMRKDISLSNILNIQNLKNLFKILFLQNDSAPWNGTTWFGLFYHISIPFFIIGIIKLFRSLILNIKSKKISGEYFILGGFLSVLAVLLTISNLNINKSNGMHLFTLAIISVGVYAVIKMFAKKQKVISVLAVVFAACFILFFGYYFGMGRAEVSKGFSKGIGSATEYVNSQNIKTVAVDRNVPHSLILFYDKTPQKVFQNTVEYENYPHRYLKAKAFGKYTLEIDYNKLGNYDAYIFPIDHKYFFYEEDFEISYFGEYGVAIRK